MSWGIDKMKLPIGQKVRFYDGTVYEKDENGALRRVPPKAPSRRDRWRAEVAASWETKGTT